MYLGPNLIREKENGLNVRVYGEVDPREDTFRKEIFDNPRTLLVYPNPKNIED